MHMPTLLNNIATYLPNTVLKNDDLALKFNVSADHIFKTFGIKQRHIAKEDEFASDLGIKACEKLIAQQNLSKDDVDFLIFCSVSFDFSAPATSCILQDKMGLSKKIGCFDLSYGCSGYIYGLALAKSILISGMAKNVLFITGDTVSKTISDNDLELRSIFSDGASVTLVNASNYASIGEFVFGTDGSGCLDIHFLNSGFKRERQEETGPGELLPNGKLRMDGMKVFNFGLKVVPQLITDTLEKNKLKLEDIDLFVFHQPSRFLLNVLRKKINIPEDKFFINIEEHGNTSSTSIPLALKDAEDQGKLKPGMTVLLAGFGVGYSWAATIIKT
ncbi:MAG: ketoacyl-ACP synthase [Bacteroidota bacterium]|jgi:3-oxoacyl-[acyl-carrier-protein] synthase-3|nr:ketoacyl-ACP synthase [Bacteroidota bacterium]